MAILEEKKIPVKKKCPVCGGKAYLKRWGTSFDVNSTKYAVECGTCSLHSEIGEGKNEAKRNWNKHIFSDTQLGLIRELKPDEVEDDCAANLIADMLKGETALFKKAYKKLLRMKSESKSYPAQEYEIKVMEKDLMKTIEEWVSEADPKAVVDQIKRDVREELDDE